MGLFGLLGAVEIYGLGRRTTLGFYAISKVRWVILDELRKVDSLPGGHGCGCVRQIGPETSWRRR